MNIISLARYRDVKIGCTFRSAELRAKELSEKWHTTFIVAWEIAVYDPVAAEKVLHESLKQYRREFEFFTIKHKEAERIALQVLDEKWRDISIPVNYPNRSLQFERRMQEK